MRHRRKIKISPQLIIERRRKFPRRRVFRKYFPHMGRSYALSQDLRLDRFCLCSKMYTMN